MKTVSRKFLLLLPVLLVSACGHWPDKSQGGYSEYRAPALLLPGNPAGDKLVLEVKDRLDCETNRLDILREELASVQQYQGQILQPIGTQITAKRELYAGLVTDSQLSIDKLSGEITSLAEEANLKDFCPIPPPCDFGTRSPAPVSKVTCPIMSSNSTSNSKER